MQMQGARAKCIARKALALKNCKKRPAGAKASEMTVLKAKGKPAKTNGKPKARASFAIIGIVCA